MRILIVSADVSLRAEIESALDSRSVSTVTIRAADSVREGVEAARAHTPDLTFVEYEPGEQDVLARFATDVATHSPESVVIAVYRPEVFGAGASESDSIIAGLRAGVQDFVRRPVSNHDLGRWLERLDSRGASRPNHRSFQVAFSSTKGGVGKSTLSVNTACELARSSAQRVLLIDASLQLGVCHTLLGLTPARNINDAASEIERLDETLLRELTVEHESGLHLLPAPSDPIEATSINDDTMARILSTARRAYDYVVVDTLPMLESVVLAVLDMSDLAYLVSQATVPSVLGQAKFLEALEKVGVSKERQRLVLNRNHARFAGEIETSDVKQRLGREVDHQVPYDRRVLTATNDGQPLVLRTGGRFRRFTQSVRRIAQEIEATAQLRAQQNRPTKPAETAQTARHLDDRRTLLSTHRPASPESSEGGR